jgi:hypothetical protein
MEDKKVEPITFRPHQDVKDELYKMMQNEDRSLSYIIERQLRISLGL